MDYADLELGIHQYKEPGYRVDFRLSLPNSDADIRTASSRVVEVCFDFECLRTVSSQPEAYGKQLTEMLFADPGLRAAFVKARGMASQVGKPLRLRLFIGPSAPRLHALRWETLVDPESGESLATDERVIFSRYLTSPDDRPVRLKQKGTLRGLVAVASPADQPPIPAAEELQRARKGLAGIPLACLAAEGAGGQPPVRATLENLINALRAEPGVDILYLVCHGMLDKDQPYVFLENAQGGTDRVSGSELARRMQQIQNCPRLVLLISCQSAGNGTGEALSALGPRLADIGVPAVIAMQYNLSVETAALFVPKFFSELQCDGQIDRAMAAARAKIKEDAFDAWVPVLFMRLRSGRLWYTPGFTDKTKAAQKFPALCQNIQQQKFTPILGPGLVEPVLGSLREISRRWANDYNYPLAPHERESLPQVAQFLSINQQSTFPITDLVKSLKKHIADTCPGNFTQNQSLNQMIEQAAAAGWQSGGLEPHQELARLDLPIFITANQDTLLEAALIAEKKAPRTILCPWNAEIVQPAGVDLAAFDGEELDFKRPIVFHLFGLWEQPKSVVLTEDHYFQFLLRLPDIKAAIPAQIREALADSGLLFLGFQIEDWSFRVIFHSLLALPVANRRMDYAQIAAQVEPEDERILEPAQARQYLEQYCSKGADIDIYWGKPEEFIAELNDALGHQE